MKLRQIEPGGLPLRGGTPGGSPLRGETPSRNRQRAVPNTPPRVGRLGAANVFLFLVDGLNFLLENLFFLLESIRRYVLRKPWPGPVEQWTDSTDWMASAAAEGLCEFVDGAHRYPVDADRFSADTGHDAPIPLAALILLFWPIPVAPPADDENHPIRAPPDRVKPKRRSI